MNTAKLTPAAAGHLLGYSAAVFKASAAPLHACGKLNRIVGPAEEVQEQFRGNGRPSVKVVPSAQELPGACLFGHGVPLQSGRSIRSLLCWTFVYLGDMDAEPETILAAHMGFTHLNQQLKPGTRPVEDGSPANKHYTAIDGNTYDNASDNASRRSGITGEWYFSSAFTAHSDQCRCFSDPDFHGWPPAVSVPAAAGVACIPIYDHPLDKADL